MAVQSHPARARLAASLADRIPGAEVVSDPEPRAHPSAWRTYRAALERPPNGATSRLVLQDDAVVPDGFPDLLAAAVASRPDRPLALWHGGQPKEDVHRLARALDQGEAWVALTSRRWVPVVALVWPARLIRPALDWVDAQKWPAAFRADDEIVGRALRALQEPVLACVPSIVEHEDVVPSLVGQRNMAGRDPGRVAAFYVDDCRCDDTGIEWERGAD